jgi:hypothetical protein
MPNLTNGTRILFEAKNIHKVFFLTPYFIPQILQDRIFSIYADVKGPDWVQLKSYEKMIYSERSWKIEHFLFLRHHLNRFPHRDKCIWKYEFVYMFSL